MNLKEWDMNIELNNKEINENKDLLNDDRGMSTTEYLVVLFLVVIGAMAAWTAFSETVSDKIDAGAEALPGGS